jgi:lysine/ornithine N-monooxygenase
MPSLEAHTVDVYDVIGLGFGPANLAVAGALLEQPREVDQYPIYHIWNSESLTF